MTTLAAIPSRFAPPSSRYPSLSLYIDDTGAGLSEDEVSEFAIRLIDVRSEAEFDHLLGAILVHAAARAGGSLSASVGSALGSLLKSIARQGFNRVASGRALGLELEGLDRNEREYETALRFVRLAAEAARHAVEESVLAPPFSVARAALAVASELYAPPMLIAFAPYDVRVGTVARRSRPIGGRTDVTWRARPLAVWAEPFDYDPEMEYFLGGLVRSAGRAVRGVTRAVGKLGPVRQALRAADTFARTASKAAGAVGRIPILGDVARAGIGAARLTLGPAAIAIDAGSRLARGENFGNALKGAVRGQIDAVRDVSRLAEMVAPFVPGVGQGVAAALGAANALAAGRPITEGVLAAARAALPGGAIAQAAFDVALNLAKGKNIAEAALEAARGRLPGGPAARAAFDGAVALAQGKRLQDAAFAAAGRVLPPSRYSANALDFVRRVASGQNIQNAALSMAGQRVVRQIRANAALATRLPRPA